MTEHDPIAAIDTLYRVQDAARARQAAEWALDTARREEHEAIRQALADGYPASTLAEMSGLSVPRIYQIRDGRRH